MTNNKKQYRIVVIEPSPIIATGLKGLIETHKKLEVVATIVDGCHYEERIRSLHPDLVIINPLMMDFKRRLCIENYFAGICEAPPVALVYQYVDPEILKHYKAVIDITDDREKIIRKLFQLFEAPSGIQDAPEGTELSEREKEILVSVARGMINKEIADRHHISVHTVITHRKNISRKTGIKSVSGLTVFAILNNLININEIE